MWSSIKSSLVLALVAGGLFTLQQSASADFVRQTVTNMTGMNANDLNLSFAADGASRGSAVADLSKPVKLRPGGGAAAVNGVLTPGTVAPPVRTMVTWAQNTFGIVANGGSVDIDFGRPNAAGNPRIVGGMWTNNGAPIGAVTLPTANPSKLTRDQFNVASVTFTNNDLVASATFSNIRYLINNDPANFDIDSFFLETGMLLPNSPLLPAP